MICVQAGEEKQKTYGGNRKASGDHQNHTNCLSCLGGFGMQGTTKEQQLTGSNSEATAVLGQAIRRYQPLRGRGQRHPIPWPARSASGATST